jgi:hypothetical protein
MASAQRIAYRPRRLCLPSDGLGCHSPERRVSGPLLDAEHVVGDVVDPARDGVAVARPPSEVTASRLLTPGARLRRRTMILRLSWNLEVGFWSSIRIAFVGADAVARSQCG